MTHAVERLLWLPRQPALEASFLAALRAGISMPINRAIIAMTTNNSIRVNPLAAWLFITYLPSL